MSEKLCADFDLGPLQGFGPGKLLPRDENEKRICAFTLALCLIFNDFKGLEWWLQQLKNGEPSDKLAINTYNGQWHGFHAQISRLSVGIFHELLVLIEDNLDLVNSVPFIFRIKKVPPKSRTTWNELVEIAATWKTKTPEQGSFKAFLHKIRSKVAFHYDPKALLSGYKEFFESDDPSAEKAYLSQGDCLEATRYYFADAAGQRAVKREFEIAGRVYEEIKGYRDMLNQPLGLVIETLLLSFKIPK